VKPVQQQQQQQQDNDHLPQSAAVGDSGVRAYDFCPSPAAAVCLLGHKFTRRRWQY